MSSPELLLQLKQMVIQCCNVKNCTVEDIVDGDPMIGGKGKLKLDSLDAVEIVMTIEQKYGIKIDNPGTARKILKSFNVLADFIRDQKSH